MKIITRLLCIALAAAIIGYIAFEVFGRIDHWYEMNYAKSDEDLGNAWLACLSGVVFSIIGGGFIGNFIYGKIRTSKAITAA